ncbi:MAG TPA: cupredoxin domain-containing protein [Thermomicrobiales bacterium]|nr:cupredoxin domain-containing protein [Thermomicrobiales bacterium]
MRKRWLTLLSVAIVAMLVLAACGSGDDDDDDAAADLSGTPVSMKDSMKFEPDTITVKAGSEVEIALSNDGAIKHNFSIDDADVDEDLDGGKSKSISFTAPDSPGEYKIHCAIPGHESAGMVATLIVEE